MKTTIFEVYDKFLSAGPDLVKICRTEKSAIKEVERLHKKYKNYPTFVTAFYLETYKT